MNNTFIPESLARCQSSRATPGSRSGCRLLRQMSFIALILVSNELLTGGVGAEEHAQPIQIGELTASWGPTPATVRIITKQAGKRHA